MNIKFASYARGLAPILIIVGIFALGGIVAGKVVAQEQSDVYPSLYILSGMPQYPKGTVTKTRQGRNLSEGAQVTIETSDSMTTIKGFFDSELANRGLTNTMGLPVNEFSTMAIYKDGPKRFSLTITRIGNGPNYKIQINYRE